jgi:hypothetical protein
VDTWNGSSGPTPPGWYRDPSGGPLWRWWDGGAWTPMTAPAYVVEDEGSIVRSERTWANVLRIFVLIDIGVAVLGGLAIAGVAWWFARKGGWDWLDREVFDDDGGGGNFGFNFNLSVPFGAGSGIFGAVWAYQATRAARALGLPTTHSPGWAAAGHLVPVINLWFPYQVLRDAFPADERPQRRLAWWWALFVAGWVPGLVGVVFAFTAHPVPAVLGIVASIALYGVSYWLRWQLVGEAITVHERIVQARGAPAASPW